MSAAAKMTREKLDRMAEVVRAGGGVRRRHKAARRGPAGGEDTKLQTNLKRLGVTPIGDIEEVNLMMDNGTVVHFPNPKVQAAIQSNTFVVSGNSETKSLAEVPGAIDQLGAENLALLERLKKQMEK
eukprot:TRINITY_DN432_c0_g3_i1.p2 TRINITY_DN432_c0_g3~~TRINITY_DN432_c0_g3_i1.p2  ORF type:complete len:127 (+),score=46.69 TRINITY_DN432_c0_g3_i1:73-453(+)